MSDNGWLGFGQTVAKIVAIDSEQARRLLDEANRSGIMVGLTSPQRFYLASQKLNAGLETVFYLEIMKGLFIDHDLCDAVFPGFCGHSANDTGSTVFLQDVRPIQYHCQIYRYLLQYDR